MHPNTFATPPHTHPPTHQVSLPAWSAVGAAGLLAGNTRLLLSVVLIVTETSGCSPVLVPIILATVVGWAVAEALAQVRCCFLVWWWSVGGCCFCVGACSCQSSWP